MRADSEGFVEPLRHASGVIIDGGRQWRLADAYLGTAVEREIKALLARGGWFVVVLPGPRFKGLISFAAHPKATTS